MSGNTSLAWPVHPELQAQELSEVRPRPYYTPIASSTHLSLTTGRSIPALTHRPQRNTPLTLQLLDQVKALILPFISAGTHAGPPDAPSTPSAASSGPNGHSTTHPAAAGVPGKTRSVATRYSPEELSSILQLELPDGEGLGQDGLLELVQKTLDYSVNTWDQGFMDKLYNSTNAVCPLPYPLVPLTSTASAYAYSSSPLGILACSMMYDSDTDFAPRETDPTGRRHI